MNPKQISATCAYILVEELIRLGITHCCMAPGARSSALSIAMRAHSSMQCHIFADERSAAFAALGMAKLNPHQCTVAILTTSGTAVANLFPAVVEASESETALLLLTADRPPELRHSRANQCISQSNIFGSYVRQSVDFDVPQIDTYHHALSQIDYLIFQSQSPIPGPVHANMMFREPMGIETDIQRHELPQRLKDWKDLKRPYTTILSGQSFPEALQRLIETTNRGCIVVGSVPIHMRACIEGFIQALGWPVILDAASGIRYRNIKYTILFHDVLLRNKLISPLETIIRIGHTFSSKWIDRSFLENAQNRIAVDWSNTNPDPESNCNYTLVTKDIREIEIRGIKISADFLNKITSYNSHVSILLSDLSSVEMRLMYELHSIVPKNGILCIGNSMPIRDFTNVSLADRPDISVFCNRGASGIDGLLSTAAGLAVTSQRHCTIVLGDLSAIHDLASLLFLKQLPLRLRIIIVNNSGGQIFQQLPLAHSEFFSPNFDAAHSTNFAQIAQAMQIESHRIFNVDALKDISILQDSSIQLIELVVDKDKERLARKQDRHKIQLAAAEIWGQK